MKSGTLAAILVFNLLHSWLSYFHIKSATKHSTSLCKGVNDLNRKFSDKSSALLINTLSVGFMCTLCTELPF